MRLFGEADYHFIERPKRAYRVSTAAMLAGIVTMVINIATRGTWQNYGVDFTGRTVARLDLVDVAAAGGHPCAGFAACMTSPSIF